MRTPLVLLSAFVALALGAATAMAQERPAAAPAAAPGGSMPMDCSSGAMKRHDHGAERNAPGVSSTACGPQAAASGAKAKVKPAHDHAKFHKNQ
jgi:hypothetical protein